MGYTFHSQTIDITGAEGFHVDFISGDGVQECIETFNPDVVVNCAAIARPKTCEDNPDMAYSINVPKHLVKSIGRALIVQISTDLVYEGHSDALYTETSPANPLNVYGKSKLMAEDFLKCKEHVCLRSSMIYGRANAGDKTNFFTQFVDEMLGASKPTDFFTDEYRCPILNVDIARIIDSIIAQVTAVSLDNADRVAAAGLENIYNMGGPESLSRFEMATMLAKERGYDPELIVTASASSFDRGVPSPLNTSMDSCRVFQVTGVNPTTFSDGLKNIFS